MSTAVRTSCHERCAQYSYWWTYRASLVPDGHFLMSECDQKCVQDTGRLIKCGRSTLEKAHSKKR